MYDQANIRLVDPHAKRVGRDGDGARRVHEPFLVGRTRRQVHPRVIRKNGTVAQARRQQRRHLIHRLAGGAIDDRAARLAAQKRKQFALLVCRLGDAPALVRQVRPIESGDDDGRLAQTKLTDNIGANIFGGRCCQRDAGRRAELLPHLAQPGILRPEIVPPLADAVGFIDGEDLRIEPGHQLLKIGGEKPLRRDVEQPVEPIGQFAHHFLPAKSLRLQRAVEKRRGDSPIAELLDLVFHQRDERRNDQRQPLVDHHAGS